MTIPATEAGRDAVKLRGLFGGETEERASKWVALIEEQARATAYRDLDNYLFSHPEVPYEGLKHSLESLFATIRADALALDVERLAVAYQRARVWCEQTYQAGWSETGDLVPRIVTEYAALDPAREDGTMMNEAFREWAVFEDEDGVFRIVTADDGDDLTWPEMNDRDCDRVVEEHNAAVRALAEARRPALDVERVGKATHEIEEVLTRVAASGQNVQRAFLALSLLESAALDAARETAPDFGLQAFTRGFDAAREDGS